MRYLSFKSLFVAVLSFTVFTVNAGNEDTKDINEDRSSVNYKQRHSSLILSSNIDNLYVDAIRIKKNISVIRDIQIERFLDENEIPADELYQGLWNTDRIHSYGSFENRPDTFMVNLETFCSPINQGHVTSKFGMRGRRMHNGIDLKVQVGDTIYAAFEGKVRIKNYEKKGYGKYLALRHPNGLETVYGHLSGYLVEIDEVVKAGQPIALGGNTGRSTGSHLHFEMRFIGMPINPADVVDFENFVCHRDQYVVTPATFKLYNSYKAIKFHTIRSGESFSSLARKYGTSINTLCKLNRMTTKSVLRIGARVRVN